MATQAAVNTRETHSLIASDKVEGTAVYRPSGEQIGEIDRVMIDKRSGKVSFAVMSFGGFLGIGEDYYPLPWSALTYNERLGGYEVNVHRAAAQERAALQGGRELELGRSSPNQQPEHLL
jgi:sporulation protein YlmC with PRC-barrel domain